MGISTTTPVVKRGITLGVYFCPDVMFYDSFTYFIPEAVDVVEGVGGDEDATVLAQLASGRVEEVDPEAKNLQSGRQHLLHLQDGTGKGGATLQCPLPRCQGKLAMSSTKGCCYVLSSIRIMVDRKVIDCYTQRKIDQKVFDRKVADRKIIH
jgi:hypothetical protein